MHKGALKSCCNIIPTGSFPFKSEPGCIFAGAIYGTHPHGMKYPEGSYDNDYLMIKMIK